jgi:hypothetical protein
MLIVHESKKPYFDQIVLLRFKLHLLYNFGSRKIYTQERRVGKIVIYVRILKHIINT